MVLLNVILGILFLAAMFFAWAVGGEYRFGKGKRGLLLAIPMTALIVAHGGWVWAIPQVLALFIVYSSLSYDKGISLVYDDKNNLGWVIIWANGVIIGLTGLVFSLAIDSLTTICMSTITGVLAIVAAVKLSNATKYASWRKWLKNNGPRYLPYKDDKGHAGWYVNFKDAWYVSEGLIGLLIGLTLLVCSW
jgi:hypothetical protein